MKRLTVALAALLLAAAPALAEEPRQRVMSIPLDMPLNEPLDGEFLEGIYQEKLHDTLRDSVLIHSPIPHIESRFTENRALALWFSSEEDGRRLFWARLTQGFEGKDMKPEAALANFAATFGEPDKVAAVKGEFGSYWILLKLDPRLGEARRATILRQLDASFTPTPDQIGDFGLTDLRTRAKLLTPDFRGAVFYLTAFKGKVGSMQTDLIDILTAEGVAPDDIFVDPLVFPVSAEETAEFSPTKLWEHSVAVAVGAGLVARLVEGGARTIAFAQAGAAVDDPLLQGALPRADHRRVRIGRLLVAQLGGAQSLGGDHREHGPLREGVPRPRDGEVVLERADAHDQVRVSAGRLAAEGARVNERGLEPHDPHVDAAGRPRAFGSAASDLTGEASGHGVQDRHPIQHRHAASSPGG